MRWFAPNLALLCLLASNAWAQQAFDAGIRVDQLVGPLEDELPAMPDLVKPPEGPYPNAGDILRAMQEVPEMKGTRTPPPPRDFRSPGDTLNPFGPSYPNADDILHEMRELPPLEGAGLPTRADESSMEPATDDAAAPAPAPANEKSREVAPAARSHPKG